MPRDYDNDGLVDIALTESGYNNNRIYVFKQAADHTFTAITTDSGLMPINDANLPPHNVLALDYDLDGDEDLPVGFADNTDGIQLWRNEEGTSNNWIVFTLEGGGAPGYANRSAVGARVEVTANGMTQTREICAGRGHQCPQVPLSLHYGIGPATPVDSVHVRWPNRSLTTRRLTNLCVDRLEKICEICTPAEEPVLRAVKNGADVVLTWDEPSVTPWYWHLYRAENPDPALCGPPYQACILDQDSGVPGIQARDFNGLGGPPLFFYRATALNDCGETPLN